jgi:hypothetical protein
MQIIRRIVNNAARFIFAEIDLIGAKGSVFARFEN